MIKRGEIYRNKKLGTEYEVLAVGICCDNDKNGQVSIIYTSNGEVYTRCQDEFLAKMEIISSSADKSNSPRLLKPDPQCS